MDTFLLWAHPVMQVVAALTGFWAMWQGVKRFAMQMGRKAIFPWKSHVRLGSVALVLWSLGALGFYVTHTVFGMTHITDLHAELAWPIVALSVFGLVSGYIMNKHKKRRKVLPMLHGLVNVLLVVLVFIECWTGYEMMGQFISL